MKYPFWFPNKKNVVWYLLFSLVFVLSMDFWGWNKSKPFIFGLPFWVVYFLLITLVVSVIFYLFARFYWGESQ